MISDRNYEFTNVVLTKFIEPINKTNSKIKNNKLYAFTLVGTV